MNGLMSKLQEQKGGPKEREYSLSLSLYPEFRTTGWKFSMWVNYNLKPAYALSSLQRLEKVQKEIMESFPLKTMRRMGDS